jgi:phosphatidylglycerol:prolipoprotein diacylglycerol transferase
MTLYGMVHAGLIIVFSTWAFLRLRREDVPPLDIVRGAAAALWGALIGAGAVAWAGRLAAGRIAQVADVFSFSGGSVLGALLGASAAGAVACRLMGWDWRWAFDLVCVPVPLAQAIGRLACHHAHCCYGRPTGSWLALVLPDAHGHVLPRYPTQLLSAGANLVIFGALLSLATQRRRRGDPWPFQGFLYAAFLVLYAAKRFGMEFLRATDPAILGPLNWPQLVCLGILGGAGAIVLREILGVRRRRA